ncbi:hypothetical protein FDECE_13914 [Fusarium decemcellulare]|nr:hypothetical protein FDECE_13914 [Fusarium decemcellulare]
MKLRYLVAFISIGVNASDVFPPCKDCLSASVHYAPGLGFGLSFSSGTAVAHLYNGTVLDLARVLGTPDYAALMARLVVSPKAPPLSRWDKWRRSINKKFGRPATPDVGTLAEMLVSLRDAAFTALGSPLDRVALAGPLIPGLADYDTLDALEHANLRPWVAPNEDLPFSEPPWPLRPAGIYLEELTEAHAVMGAHGLGLCKNYHNLWDCTDEEFAMPLEKVMVVGFTEVDLRAEVRRARSPFTYLNDPEPVGWFVDLKAGLDALDSGALEPEEVFWGYVGDRLKTLVSGLPVKLTRVLLVGENSTHPTFLSTIRDVMERSGYGGYGHEGRVLVASDGIIDPTFSSARGAAQYARWRQEAPLGCEERPECRDERREENRKDLKH